MVASCKLPLGRPIRSVFLLVSAAASGFKSSPLGVILNGGSLAAPNLCSKNADASLEID
jgi:hypothetical protein